MPRGATRQRIDPPAHVLMTLQCHRFSGEELLDRRRRERFGHTEVVRDRDQGTKATVI